MEAFLFILMLAGFGWLFFRINELERRLEKAERRAMLFGGASGALSEPEPAPSAPRAAPEAAQARPKVAAEPEPPAALAQSEPEPPRAPQRPLGPPAGQRLRTWLEENGLAWAGGAVLALGG
ncbi:MAG TPA: hypothetical protein VHK87_04475, partial [Phenylobacterium sp.]|nr:hypothetical protein [Phenylobacterium sp.]